MKTTGMRYARAATFAAVRCETSTSFSPFAMRSILSKGDPTTQSGRKRPGLAAVSHVPEHPFVAAAGEEVAMHVAAFGGSELEGEIVGQSQYGIDEGAELGRSI